jgi:hypothetical protein
MTRNELLYLQQGADPAIISIRPVFRFECLNRTA